DADRGRRCHGPRPCRPLRPSLPMRHRWMAARTGRAVDDIRVSGVTRTFAIDGERLPALDGVDLHVPDRGITAIVGPSGSGKSTLLRLIAGLLVPDGGSIAVGGRPVQGPDPAVGLVFQEPRLLPWRTAIEN